MVSVKLKVSMPGGSFDRWLQSNVDVAAGAVTKGVTQATRSALSEMRQQMTSAGLGRRLPNALRGTVYPQRENSLKAKGVIQPKDGEATSIFQAFTEGATIRGRTGNWLAIPTENVPRTASGRGSPRKMTPQEVEESFNQDLIIKRSPKPNVFTAWINAVDAKSRKGFRRATPKRLAQGRNLKLVMMFTLIRVVRLNARLQPAPIVEKWAGLTPILISQALPK